MFVFQKRKKKWKMRKQRKNNSEKYHKIINGEFLVKIHLSQTSHIIHIIEGLRKNGRTRTLRKVK